jgi:hypothetical protein
MESREASAQVLYRFLDANSVLSRVKSKVESPGRKTKHRKLAICDE